jgi:hypothetical protein
MTTLFEAPPELQGRISQAEIIVARDADIKGGAGGADFRTQFHTDIGSVKRCRRRSIRPDNALAFAGSRSRPHRIFQMEVKLAAAKGAYQRRWKHYRGKQQRRYSQRASPSFEQPTQSQIDGNKQQGDGKQRQKEPRKHRNIEQHEYL